MINVSDWPARNAAWRRDHPAIVSRERIWTYRDLDLDVAELAAMFVETLRLRPGDRIAVLSYNRPEVLVAIFAAARIRASVVPLNWRLAPPEHARILGECAPDLLLVDADLRDRADGLAAAAPRARRVGLGFASEQWQDHRDLIAAYPFGIVSEMSMGGGGDELLLVYTSGTTGRPKGAVITHDQVAANAANAIWAHDLTSADRVLTMLPLFHVGGLNIQTLPALQAGATVLLHSRFNPGEALAAIARDRPSLILLVPAVMKAMIEHRDWAGTDLSSLRLAMAGSSVVPVELIRAWHARGVPVGQVYGATETGPVSIVLKGADARRKEGACGTPAIHCAARIVDRDACDVLQGERGEILLRGPHIVSDYWRDATATHEAFADGWFRTGDIGHQDEEGYFWIDDRKQDMIISGGENIYPAELEAVLEGHPAIAEAAVVARADPRWGEVPVAVIVRRPGAAIDAEAVKELFAGRLARFKHPHDVVFVDTLPRNAMGKVLRYRLRGQVAGTVTPPEAP